MSTPADVVLGDWTTPSGNNVIVSIGAEQDGSEHLHCAWDRLPLSVVDELYWVAKILPAVTVRLAEYQERPVLRGGVLVIRA